MNIKRLSEGSIGKEYIVEKIDLKDNKILNQLKNVGIERNSKIKTMFTNYKKKTFLLKVNEIDYAISKKICDCIEVYEL